ncbi:MAG: MnmC family methyltransferase [Campylobacterales bacterium]
MELIKTGDGSYTLWNREYRESYHSREGAVLESYYKHIRPGLEGVLWSFKSELERGEVVEILDICFGLGYNTLMTLRFRPVGVKVKILAPELDKTLLSTLPNFRYPPELEGFKGILEELVQTGRVAGEWGEISLFIGDARDLLKGLPENSIHLCYQDPFSPRKNPELWTLEYFKELKRVLKPAGLLTTYSVATPARYPLYRLGFHLYTHPYPFIRGGTIASLAPLPFPPVNFEEKLARTQCRYYRERGGRVELIGPK